MKKLKRLMAMLFSLAILIAGLYILPREAQASTSVVNNNMLTVKCQMVSTPLENADQEHGGKQGDHLVRLVSSVDTLKYQAVGFIVTYEGLAEPMSYISSTVYKRINSQVGGENYAFGPKVVDVSSEYFITAKTYFTPGVEYKVQAYVVTTSGDTVYGEERYINTNDTKDDTTVVSFSCPNNSYKEGDKILGVTINNATTPTYEATVLYADSNIVKISIPLEDSTLPSVTVFNIPSYGNEEYRNLYLDSTTADNSWYTVYDAIYNECEDESLKREFVIATKADLLALDGLVDNQEIQANDIIYLASDITFGDDSTWTPVGQTNAFPAIFDGNNHKISGLNIVAGDNSGFFGITSGSTIKDLEIVDADYNATKGTNIGIIAGKGYGTFENITIDNTSSVTMNTTNKNVGGIIGQVVSNETASFVNCTVNANVTSKGQIVGGFIGLAYKTSTVHITGCTFDANVQSDEAIVGGLIGQVDSSSTIRIKQTAIAGHVKTIKPASGNGKAQAGGMIGRLIESTITVEECLVSATIEGLQHVGGLVGFAYANTANKDCEITVTDCHISGRIGARAGEKANTGALVGYAQDSNTSSDTNEITIDVTRCLMSGSIYMTNGTAQTYKSVFVGQIANEVNLTFNDGVCYVKDNLDVTVKDEEYQLYQGATTGTITGDSGVAPYTEAELKGQNPFENNSKWTDQTDTVPTLSIFATSN